MQRRRLLPMASLIDDCCLQVQRLLQAAAASKDMKLVVARRLERKSECFLRYYLAEILHT